MTYNRADDTIAEVEWIAGTDTAESIARRLGYRRLRGLLEMLREHGRPDLALRLRGIA